MYVQNPPVIPSLHNLKGAECKSPACRSKSNRIIDGWSVNYHDCIVIENTINEKLPITDDLDENSTLWPSTNAESVGELFIGFCKHLSTKQNLFSKVSITEPSNEMKDLEEWKGRKCVVQDPFNLKKNLA
jgi:hypothetical protein